MTSTHETDPGQAEQGGRPGADTRPLDPPQAPGRRTGELTLVELLRWSWRQLTSMRTALVLLLLLALAAVPGSIVPQSGVDSQAVSRWKGDHPTLTPVYERLGLFSVYDSVWFSAIFLLLVVSLVGCILPRTAVYARGLRQQPPRAPRRLDRIGEGTSYATDEEPDVVLARAATLLRRRRFRVVRAGERRRDGGRDDAAVAAERGYLREAGNLLFHVAVVVVLVGFALGNLFGYKGGVIVPVDPDQGFSNLPTSYDDLEPGSLFDPSVMEPFTFSVDDFDVQWRDGTARKFVSHLTYRDEPGAGEQTYDLRVNHPLTIGDTEVFLIGHGYAPDLTVRDADGDVVSDGPTTFLPEDQTFRSFGVVKAASAGADDIGLEGLFFPSYVKVGGDPVNFSGELKNPTISMLAYAGDLGLSNGEPQSVYELRTDDMRRLDKPGGKMFRVDLQVGQTIDLPDGRGSVTFNGVERWNRIQISRTPGKELALGGVVLALVGLLGSLFIRPRRLWVRARRDPSGGPGTLVEVAALDRSGGGDVAAELEQVVAALRGPDPTSSGDAPADRPEPPGEEEET